MKNIKGQMIENADIGAKSWFRCGGAADLLFHPADQEDLANFLMQYPAGEPITVLGGLANTIIRDGGIRGVCIQMDKNMAAVTVMDEIYISAQAGALNGSVAAAAMKAGIGGLEFLSGIPGSIGGAMAMNAGAYGTEMKDVLVGVTALSRSGQIKRYTADQIKMSYRSTRFPEWCVVTSVLLKGRKEDYETVKARMNDIKTRRNETQPIREDTGGSTFANPSADELRRAGLPEGTRAWKVVELVGGRGLRMGGAMMSEQHCNFMCNTGGATARDLENLGEELRARAKLEFGLDLHWEIKRVGEKP